MSLHIRLARPDDAEACQEIYRLFVEDTAVSFETEVPAPEAFRARMEGTLAQLPWLVCLRGRGLDSPLAGYAYAAPFRSRPAYRWNVEVTVYVAEHQRRRGVPRVLYGQLLEGLRRQGFVNALAVITLPNPGSLALHKALGFAPVGVFPRSGYKLGAWHDVGWWALGLQAAPTGPAPADPSPPRPLPAVAAGMEWRAD